MEPEHQKLVEELINGKPFTETADMGGKTHTCGARVPLSMYRQIVSFCERPGSPYEIGSDVVRDAIYIGLRIIDERFKRDGNNNGT